MLAKKGDNIVLEAHVRVTLFVGNNIPKISNMSLLLEGPPMSFVMRVEMRTSCCAPIGEVSKLMDMDAVFAVWVQTLQRHRDLHRVIQRLLAE